MLNLDIGDVGLPGGVSYANGAISVSGSGLDIGGIADAFHYVNLPVIDGGQVTAHVASQTSANPGAKAGVMIRDTLDPGAGFASMALTPGQGAIFQWRALAGAPASSIGLAGMAAPYWVKLARSGATLTGYVSSDGTTWTDVGSATVATHGIAYVGLAVTAHDIGALNTATFDHVSITP